MAKSAEPNTIVAASDVSGTDSLRPAMRFVPQFSLQKRSSNSSASRSGKTEYSSRGSEVVSTGLTSFTASTASSVSTAG